MEKELTQLLEDNLKQIFGERDEVRRMAAIKKIYSKDFTVFEVGGLVKGYDDLAKHINAILKNLPPDFVFKKIKPVIINNNVGRMVWGLGPEGKDPVATGMDIVHFEEGKIKSLYVFLDN